jgi:hypothetical protein
MKKAFVNDVFLFLAPRAPPQSATRLRGPYMIPLGVVRRAELPQPRSRLLIRSSLNHGTSRTEF